MSKFFPCKQVVREIDNLSLMMNIEEKFFKREILGYMQVHSISRRCFNQMWKEYTQNLTVLCPALLENGPYFCARYIYVVFPRTFQSLGFASRRLVLWRWYENCHLKTWVLHDIPSSRNFFAAFAVVFCQLWCIPRASQLTGSASKLCNPQNFTSSS